MFAVDPVLGDPGANATACAVEALSFATFEDADRWCRANPSPEFAPCSLLIEFSWLQ